MSELSTAQHLVDTILSANVSGLTAGTNIFYNKKPANISRTLATAVVYDTAGNDPQILADKSNFAPSVQILVYGPPDGYSVAQQKAFAIRDYLVESFGSQTVGATTYVGCYAVGDVMFMEYDADNRPIFSMNFRFDKHY